MPRNERTYRQLHPRLIDASLPQPGRASLVVGGAVVVAALLYFTLFLFVLGPHW